MSNQVILEEGTSFNVHTRIKDLCKQARNRLGLSNQDIADAISKRFGLEDFSVNTVNNFFSERSKATTIYTTGCICAVLDISIDAAFGIQHADAPSEDIEFVKQLSELKVDVRLKDQEIAHLKEVVTERDDRLKQAHEALGFYRSAAVKDIKSLQFKSTTLLAILLLLSLTAIVLLIIFK